MHSGFFDSCNPSSRHHPVRVCRRYCRFYLGRRSPDDERQIARWVGVAGAKSGRWKNNLIHKCVAANAAFDDETVVRTLVVEVGAAV